MLNGESLSSWRPFCDTLLIQVLVVVGVCSCKLAACSPCTFTPDFGVPVSVLDIAFLRERLPSCGVSRLSLLRFSCALGDMPDIATLNCNSRSSTSISCIAAAALAAFLLAFLEYCLRGRFVSRGSVAAAARRSCDLVGFVLADVGVDADALASCVIECAASM